jgi:hypothetical protein
MRLSVGPVSVGRARTGRGAASSNVLGVVLLVTLGLGGCLQTEGERCQVNSDCQDGLSCCVGDDPDDVLRGGFCCAGTQDDAAVDAAVDATSDGASDADGGLDAPAVDVALAVDTAAGDAAPDADASPDAQADADAAPDAAPDGNAFDGAPDTSVGDAPQ